MREVLPGATPAGWNGIVVKHVRMQSVLLHQWDREVAFRISDVRVDLLAHLVKVCFQVVFVLKLFLFFLSVPDQRLSTHLLLATFHGR